MAEAEEVSVDCSWKKMVIAKANNEWISTIKTEEIGHNEMCRVKTESKGMDSVQQNSAIMDVAPISMIQELDPLFVKTCKRIRRRSKSASKFETPEERCTRLAKMSAYAAQRLANETVDQRATRLRRMSEYAAKRLSQETSEQRAKRLARMSAYAAKRLAEETPEQRKARLARMSAYAARRLAMKKTSSHNTENSSCLIPNSVTINES